MKRTALIENLWENLQFFIHVGIWHTCMGPHTDWDKIKLLINWWLSIQGSKSSRSTMEETVCDLVIKHCIMLSMHKSMWKWSNMGTSLVLGFIGLCNVGRVCPMQFLGYCVADILGECFKVNQFNKLLMGNKTSNGRELTFVLMRWDYISNLK